MSCVCVSCGSYSWDLQDHKAHKMAQRVRSSAAPFNTVPTFDRRNRPKQVEQHLFAMQCHWGTECSVGSGDGRLAVGPAQSGTSPQVVTQRYTNSLSVNTYNGSGTKLST